MRELTHSSYTNFTNWVNLKLTTYSLLRIIDKYQERIQDYPWEGTPIYDFAKIFKKNTWNSENFEL